MSERTSILTLHVYSLLSDISAPPFCRRYAPDGVRLMCRHAIYLVPSCLVPTFEFSWDMTQSTLLHSHVSDGFAASIFRIIQTHSTVFFCLVLYFFSCPTGFELYVCFITQYIFAGPSARISRELTANTRFSAALIPRIDFTVSRM